MKKHFILYSVLIFTPGLSQCNRSGELKVEISTCEKQLAFVSTDFTDASNTILNILHQGFCYDCIESLYVSRKFISGTKNAFIYDTLTIEKPKIEFADITDKSSLIKLKLQEKSDTAETISVNITAIYDNKTRSNSLAFTYQLPCKKEISNPEYVLLDTMSCETSAGKGDRFMVSFTHKGYCTQEIDSIVGHGEFYSNDGYYWNSSSYLVPKERIMIEPDSTYQRQISHRLCVTFSYSDYVQNKFYAVYKDGTKSNELILDIKFDYKSADANFKNGSDQMK